MHFLGWHFMELSSSSEKLVAVSQMLLRRQISYYPPAVTRFEQAFAKAMEIRHAATFSNGTSALEAALFALGIGQGDEIISPSYTIHATFSPALTLGTAVRFVDIDPATLTADPGQIEKSIGPHTKAIIAVHIWGNPANMDAIMDVARRHDLKVIEDCSHAHGATWRGQPVGSFGDIGVFSLQGAKPVAAGEGGIAITNSAHLLDRMLAYGHQGRRICGTLDKPEQSAFFPVTGFGRKCRAHPLGIALAAIDLRRLGKRNDILRQCWAYLDRQLKSDCGLELQRPLENAQMAGYFLGAAIRVTGQTLSPDEVMNVLKTSGVIATRRVQTPNHKLPHLYDLASRAAMQAGNDFKVPEAPVLPHTERAITHVIFLPLEQFVSRRRRRALDHALRLLSGKR